MSTVFTPFMVAMRTHTSRKRQVLDLVLEIGYTLDIKKFGFGEAISIKKNGGREVIRIYLLSGKTKIRNSGRLIYGRA